MDFGIVTSMIMAVVVVSLISLIGIITLMLSVKNLQRLTGGLVSLAAGSLLGDVFFHILPELQEEVGFDHFMVAMLIGVLSFFVLEHFFHWHHQHHPHDHDQHTKSVAYVNLFADGLHNFIDGLVIAAAFLVDMELGIATSIAVALHEIPQELGDFGVMIDAGFSRGKALAYNLVSALMAVAGAVTVIAIGGFSAYAANILLAFAGGGFLYISVADLLPKLYNENRPVKTVVQFVIVVIGLAIMLGLTSLE